MKVKKDWKWCTIVDATEDEIKNIAQCLTFIEEEEPSEIELEEEIGLSWEGNWDYFVFLNKEDGKFKFLSGLLPYFKEQYDGDFEVITDGYYEPPNFKVDLPYDYLDGISLRDYQKYAAEKALYFRRGILDIPTRGGKTEILVAIAKYYLEEIKEKGKLIVIEPDSNLMKQTYNRFKKRGYTDVGRLGDGHRELDCSVVVCIVDSLYNIVRDPDHEDYDKIQLVSGILIDEVHHAGSPSMAQVPIVIPDLDLLIGVSGSPFNDQAEPHTNPRDAAIIGLLHNVILKITSRYLMNKGFIAEPHVFIFGYGGKYPRHFISNYNRVYSKYIMWNRGRNNMISNAAEMITSYDLNCLVLVTRIPHGKHLLKKINSFCPNTLFSFGGGNTIRYYEGFEPDNLPEGWEWYRDEDDKKKGKKYFLYPQDQEVCVQNHFDGKTGRVLIGSTVFDEGVDLPQVDAVIIAGAQGKSDVKNTQRPARALTKNKFDNKVYIIDFWDDKHKYLKNHSELRVESYQQLQYYIHTGGVDELEEHLKVSQRIRQEVNE